MNDFDPGRMIVLLKMHLKKPWKPLQSYENDVKMNITGKLVAVSQLTAKIKPYNESFYP